MTAVQFRHSKLWAQPKNWEIAFSIDLIGGSIMVILSTGIELTAGCNACHQSTGRGFIVMTVPTASSFGNQSFAPREGQGKGVTRR